MLTILYNTDKTVFEKTKARPKDKRKRVRKLDASDIDGFEGPWGKYVDEKTVAKPSEVSFLDLSVKLRS